MGRKKIQITRIADERNRQITFSKRKAGLLKKAYELSILCDVEIAVIMISNHNKLYQYASSNMNSILIRYTEFKDPDESKTNADILDDLNRRDKSGNESGEEDTDSQQLPISPAHAHYPQLEEFEQVLGNDMSHQDIDHHAPIISLTAPTNPIPLAMPVTVPVSKNNSPLQKATSQLGSAGSSMSPNTPLSQQSPFSDNNTMPPPATTPTRLQTIRSHALKLHLPGKSGGGTRSYVPLRTSSTDSNDKGTNSPSNTRPQLTVVIPGQKGFVPTSVGSPPLVNIEQPSSPNHSPPPLQAVTKAMAPPTMPPQTSTVPASNNPTMSGSLTTPIMSLATPNLVSSLPPGLSNEGPLGDVGSTSALVAFPVNIQHGNTTSPGSNLIIQAQNMGQPFLLTPTPNQGGATSMITPPILGGNSDFEQLKLQYDRIFQQIQTLQHQIQAQDQDGSVNGDKPNGKREQDEPTEDGLPNSKKPNLA